MGSLLDGLSVLKYLIVIELVLLFLPTYFGGRVGAALTVISSTLIVTWLYAAMVGMSAAYSNGPSRSGLNYSLIIGAVVIGLLFSFLAVGMSWFVDFVKLKKELGPPFYFWLAIVVGALVVIVFIRYQNDPIRLMDVKIEREVKERNVERVRLKEIQKKVLNDLNSHFNNAINDLTKVKDYVELSEQTSLKHKGAFSLATHFANYTTKLMIHSMQNNDFEVAEVLFNSYVDSIIPNSGLSEKSSDVASNAIVLAILASKEIVFTQVEDQILGVGFEIDDLNNEMLLFNLACHYALKKEESKMLKAIRRARALGKSAESFLKDKDFEYYKGNQKFLKAVE